MIELEGLTVAVGDKTLLRDVDLTVRRGQKVVVRGESGAGKTTLLRAIIGQRPATRGSVRVAGVALSPSTAAEIRRGLCYVPQSVSHFEDDRAAEFLAAPFRYRANRESEPAPELVSQTLQRLRLPADLGDARVADLSGGERQRLALARALLLRRPLLLLDEVTSALDGASRDAALDLLLDDEETTILAVSHDPEWWSRCAVRYELCAGGALSPAAGQA